MADEQDRKALIAQQEKDGTLQTIRQWTLKNECGYSYHYQVHTIENEDGQRVVVPKVRREEILRLYQVWKGNEHPLADQGVLQLEV